jgi:hypothetical protein
MSEISKIYNLTKVHKVDFHLGMVFTRDRTSKTITISQPGNTDEILDNYNIPLDIPSYPLTPMSDAPRSLPSDTNKLLVKKGIEDYQSKIESLLYLANQTRYYTISRYYIKIRRRYYFICYRYINRKSHTGCTLHIGSKHSGSFLTRSKQQTVTASSTIAELIAAFTVTKEITWARSLLAEIGYSQLEPTIIYEGNMSTIAKVNNDGNSQKTKHIDIRYNLTREQVKNKVITMKHL